MELKQLEYFLMVSNLKSFTRAAEQLYVSQPGVTTAIRRLEEELGIQLFVRNKKNAVLTAEGRVFFNHVESVMRDVSKAITTVNQLKTLNSGTITIGLPPAAQTTAFARLLIEFRTIYPALNLLIIEEGSAEINKQLEEDKLDLAVLIPGDNTAPLEIAALEAQELVACMPVTHSLAKRKALTPVLLEKEALILFKEDCWSRQIILRYFHDDGVETLVSFGSNHLQTMKQLVAGGAGIAILPRNAVENDKQLAGIAFSPPLTIPTGLAYKKNRHLSHAAQTFLSFIKANS